MAIITHRTSKNARYGDVLDYYSFRHEENQKTGHYEPVLDDNGLMIERHDYAVAYITARGEEAEPELWAAACMKTNRFFRKNLSENDRKNHEYIISHPTEDRERMTMEDLMEEGKAFVREYFFGYDALIGIHRDTDNDHIHISINSVRALGRIEQDWMMRDRNGYILPCEVEAGGKHQDSPGLRIHMNDWLLEYTRQHGLTEKDNNAIASAHRAQRHGKKNDQMRAALLEAAGRSQNMTELQRIMKTDYGMELKASSTGRTISILYPGNDKYVRLRTLGLEPTDLSRRFTGAEYAFTQAAEEQQLIKEIEKREKKSSIEWIRERRQRNNEKAEEAIARAEEILSRRLRGRGEKYDKLEFQDLRYLIRQTAYLESSLQTEKEKLDKVLDRWRQYQDMSLPEQERQQHSGYIRWCGCDPDNSVELERLLAERETIEAQQGHAAAMREALMAEAERWKGRNHMTRAENDLAWTKYREKQLKIQLRNCRASRKKLWEISCNCRRAARRYDDELWEEFGREAVDFINPKWDNVYKFEDKYCNARRRERELESKLKEIKIRRKEAAGKLREAKAAGRAANRGR